MPNKPTQRSKKRPKYMYIFNDLLKRHNDAQPKFFSKKRVVEDSEKESEKEKPSLSYSNTSTPSIDPAKVSSYTQSAAPTITNKASSELSTSDKDSSSRLTAISSPFSSQDNQQQEQSSSRNISKQNNHFVQLEQRDRKLVPTQVSDSGGGGGSTSQNKLPNLIKLPPSWSPRLQQQQQQQQRSQPQPQQPTTNSTSMSIDRPSLPSQQKLSTATTTTTTTTQRASELLKNSKQHFKDSAPNVSQAPTAVMGNSSTQQHHQHKQHAGPKRKIIHTSMAKTIAEQTPNAFKTLGPGFNAKAPAEKSFNPLTTTTSSSLGGFTLPSDYEHIFHAPSQISDLATSSRSSEHKQASPKMNANKKTSDNKNEKRTHKTQKTPRGQTNRGSSKKH